MPHALPSRGPWRLRVALTLVAVIAGAMQLAPSTARATTLNPIQQENSLPGTPGWDQFASVAQQDAISGFASSTSVNHGGSIDFYVTTTAASVKIDIFRAGWYQGSGARLVESLGTFPGVHQPIPAPDPVTGMVSCSNWTKTTTLSVPSSWVTGVYLAKLSASSGNDSFIIFVVRDDGGTEPILFQTSVTTYEAYNEWGGVSLYDNSTNGSVYKYAHATKVSFDRPFDPLDGNGAGHFFAYEYPFIRWAESQGYDISYITDVDTATNVNPLTNHRVYLSVGHDEYWSHSMRDNVTNAIAQGVNAAFFSANTSYWQIRFEPNVAGVPNRVEVGYKEFATDTTPPGPDPMSTVNNSIVTTNWRAAPVNLPENSFIGVMYEGQVNKDSAYIVQNAGNWIYAGSGFTNGTSIPGIVGYEYDRVYNNGFSPPGETVLSSSPVTQCCGAGSGLSNSTLYTAPSGAQVFSGGTIQWAWGLDNYSSDGQYVNAGIQKTTANILNAFSQGTSSPAPAVTLTPTSVSFGNQLVGSTSGARTVTLTNSGTAALTISSIGVTGANAGDFSESDTCPSGSATLAAGGSCTIVVTFGPTASGSRTASLTVSDNAVGTPHTVSLSGNGVAPAPTVGLNPTSLAFAAEPLGTASAPQSVTLTNTGNADLSISDISLADADPGDFAQTNTCPTGSATLSAGASCTISVTFMPTAGGSRKASLSIADNAAGSPQTVALSGTGDAPAVTFTPSTLTFAAQLVGTTSSGQSVTVTNSGTAALAISSVALAGTNASDFAQATTCPTDGTTVAPGATCTISVTFTPNATGARTGTLTVADNAPGSPQGVALSGSGTAPAPAVGFSPVSLSYGNQLVGTTTAAQTTTLTNTGSAALSISGIAVTGTNAGEFGQTNTCPTGGTLAAGASCTISVDFSPGATGSKTASLQVTDDAADSPQRVPLSGTGTAPALTLSPTNLSFGSQALGTTSPGQSITLTNSGTAPLSISSIGMIGTNPGDYAQTNTCPTGSSTLAAGVHCAITVTFTPAATGARTATLAISDNASGSPHDAALSGTGSTSAIAFDKTLGQFAENASGSTIKLTTSAAAASNGRIFAFVDWYSGAGTLSSLSGGGLTWRVDVQAKDGTGYHTAIASAGAPNGLAAGTVLTATFSRTVKPGLIAAASFTGIASSGPVDVTASKIQAGVAAWTATAQTTNANDLVLGFSGIDKITTNTAASPNTKIFDFGNSVLGESATAEYQIATSTGTKTSNGTWASASGATANSTVIAAYKSS